MSWLSNIVAWFVNKDPVAAAGKRAVAEAERYFALDVKDFDEHSTNPRVPFWKAIIQGIIDRAGWGWVKYVGNTTDEKKACQWCGMFVAACWRAAGIDPKWLRDFFASTNRLVCWAEGEAWNGTPAGGPRMYIELSPRTKRMDVVFPDGSLPQAGDILIVGNGVRPTGNHITLVVSYDPATGIFKTINGNGGGLGPDGLRREGIVKTSYAVGETHGYHPMFVIRLLESDLLRS